MQISDFKRLGDGRLQIIVQVGDLTDTWVDRRLGGWRQKDRQTDRQASRRTDIWADGKKRKARTKGKKDEPTDIPSQASTHPHTHPHTHPPTHPHTLGQALERFVVLSSVQTSPYSIANVQLLPDMELTRAHEMQLVKAEAGTIVRRGGWVAG